MCLRILETKKPVSRSSPLHFGLATMLRTCRLTTYCSLSNTFMVMMILTTCFYSPRQDTKRIREINKINKQIKICEMVDNK